MVRELLHLVSLSKDGNDVWELCLSTASERDKTCIRLCLIVQLARCLKGRGVCLLCLNSYTVSLRVSLFPCGPWSSMFYFCCIHVILYFRVCRSALSKCVKIKQVKLLILFFCPHIDKCSLNSPTGSRQFPFGVSCCYLHDHSSHSHVISQSCTSVCLSACALPNGCNVCWVSPSVFLMDSNV